MRLDPCDLGTISCFFLCARTKRLQGFHSFGNLTLSIVSRYVVKGGKWIDLSAARTVAIRSVFNHCCVATRAVYFKKRY